MYDIIIIGGGPAGLTAATNTAHRGMKTLVIEQYERPGGQPLIFYPDKVIKDHPGFPVGILGKEFARMLEMQAKNAGAEIHCNEEALKVWKDKKKIFVRTNEKTYSAEKVILATGMLNIPSKLLALKEYKGRHVHYKIGDIKKFSGKKVIVIGGGDNAFDTAVQIADSSSVTILVKHGYAKAKEVTVNEAQKKGVKILYHTELIEISTDKHNMIEKIKIYDSQTKKEKFLKCDEIFSAIGFSPVNKFLKDNNFELYDDGSIFVNENYETSIKGVFAAGDITGEVKLIAVACAEGIIAAIKSFSQIKKPYWLK